MTLQLRFTLLLSLLLAAFIGAAAGVLGLSQAPADAWRRLEDDAGQLRTRLIPGAPNGPAAEAAREVLELENAIGRLRAAHGRAALQSAALLVVVGLLSIGAVGLWVRRSLLRPLQEIDLALTGGKAPAFTAFSAQNHELGRIADALARSAEQQQHQQNAAAEHAALEEKLRASAEERARLARNLHDGPIQSLYAAGMNLTAVPALLNRDPRAAAARVEDTRAVLNATIQELRQLMSGLEPAPGPAETFSQAIETILGVMRGIRPFESQIEIDAALAAQLTLAQRVQALQIAREAVSNAVRHGAASHIQIALRKRGAFAEFEVIDNGTGFDRTTASTGNGLANFEARARDLAADFRLESQPGRGTRVKLAFAFPPPSA